MRRLVASAGRFASRFAGRFASRFAGRFALGRGLVVGVLAPGSSVDFDVAVKMKPAIDDFLQQTTAERAEFRATHERLLALAGKISALREQLAGQSGAQQVKKAS